MKKFAYTLMAAIALLSACEGGSGGTPASSAPPKTEPAPTTKPAASATTEPAVDKEEPKVELVEKDLSPAGAAFKGWVAKGPADAEVMQDLSGARIATKKVAGPGSFDLAFKLEKADLKLTKDGANKGAELAKSKVTFTTDSPEALEWTTETGSIKSYSFMILMKVNDKDVTCYTVSPRESEADVTMHKDACKTLAKK